MKKVGFIGCPDLSSVARQALTMAECDLAVWYPENTARPKDNAQAVELTALSATPLIVFSAPLNQCRPLARRLGDVITGRHIVVHTVRGLEPETLKTVSDILQEETPTQRLGFVTGPMRAEDLSAGRPGSGVCASLFPEVHDLIEEAMVSPAFRLYRSKDLVGAEISAAYGRVVSLMSGLVDGLNLGASLQATLFARGLAEMSRFVIFRGGYERTTFGLSGCGNLFADTHTDGNVDFQIGRFLAEGPDDVATSLVTEFGTPAEEILAMMNSFREVGSSAELELPLLDGVLALINQGLPPQKVVQALMSLPTLYE